MSKVIIIFVTITSLSWACLITNCPRGGKRGGSTFLLQNLPEECPVCGPEEQGQCFGPHICCSPSMGCLIGTAETFSCRKESIYSRSCIAGFAMCQENNGRCAANGICCSEESCFIDTACKLIDEIGIHSKIGLKLGASLLKHTRTNEHILQ